jgi:hypothetical protein
MFWGSTGALFKPEDIEARKRSGMMSLAEDIHSKPVCFCFMEHPCDPTEIHLLR